MVVGTEVVVGGTVVVVGTREVVGAALVVAAAVTACILCFVKREGRTLKGKVMAFAGYNAPACKCSRASMNLALRCGTLAVCDVWIVQKRGVEKGELQRNFRLGPAARARSNSWAVVGKVLPRSVDLNSRGQTHDRVTSHVVKPSARSLLCRKLSAGDEKVQLQGRSLTVRVGATPGAPVPLGELHVELHSAVGNGEGLAPDCKRASLLEKEDVNPDPRVCPKGRAEWNFDAVQAVVRGVLDRAEGEGLSRKGVETVLRVSPLPQHGPGAVQLAQRVDLKPNLVRVARNVYRLRQIDLARLA